MSVTWPDVPGLPGVGTAVEAVRTSIAALRRHPATRQQGAEVAAAAGIRAARASAAIDGAPLAAASAAAHPLVAGALRAGAALPGLVPTWRRAPLQALARLHTLAAADLVGPDLLGRPRPGDPTTAPRLAALADLVAGGPTGPAGWPGPVRSAVVHAELLGLAPFGSADGIVARAAARLEGMADGLDPAGLAVPEVAFLRAGPGYLAAAARYAGGAPAGVADWIVFACDAWVRGAREGGSIADAAVG